MVPLFNRIFRCTHLATRFGLSFGLWIQSKDALVLQMQLGDWRDLVATTLITNQHPLDINDAEDAANKKRIRQINTGVVEMYLNNVIVQLSFFFLTSASGCACHFGNKGCQSGREVTSGHVESSGVPIN